VLALVSLSLQLGLSLPPHPPSLQWACNSVLHCLCVRACRGHSGIVTEAGEALVVGRTFEFGNTMRLINYSRGMSWFAKVVNGVADAFRDTPLTPRLVEVDNDVAVPVFQSIVCSPGPLTVILSGACAMIIPIGLPCNRPTVPLTLTLGVTLTVTDVSRS
jgi:hypothetical protein